MTDHERLRQMLVDTNARVTEAQAQLKREPYVSPILDSDARFGLYTEEERAAMREAEYPANPGDDLARFERL